MQQPARTRAEAYGIYILRDTLAGDGNDSIVEPAYRVQTADISPDVGAEDLQELANQGIVESKADTPVVTISLSGNQVAKDISPNSISGLQWLALISNNISSGSGREKIFAIGDPLRLHPSSYSPSSAVDVDDFNIYISSLTEGQKMSSTCDIFVPIRGATELDRVFYVAQAHVTALSWSFDVGGVATFDTSLEADNRIFLQSADAVEYQKAEVQSKKVTTAEAAASPPSITTSSSSDIYRVYLNGEQLDEASDVAARDAVDARKWFRTSATDLSFSPSLLTAGDVVRYLYLASSGTPTWAANYELTSAPGDQGGIRKGELDIFMIRDTTVGRVVEGLISSLVSSNTLTITKGTLYLVNSANRNKVELFRLEGDYSIGTLGMTASDSHVWGISSSTGYLAFQMGASSDYDSAINPVLISTVTVSGTPSLDSVVDARDFARNKLSLIQTAGPSADLGRELIQELGNKRIVERSLNKPVPISLDLTAMDIDGEIETLLRGGDPDSLVAADGIIELEDWSDKLGVQVNLYTSTERTDANKKAIIEAVDLRPTTNPLSMSVGGSGELSVTLTGDNLRAFEVA